MAEYGAKIQTIVSPLRIFLSLKFYPTLCGNSARKYWRGRVFAAVPKSETAEPQSTARHFWRTTRRELCPVIIKQKRENVKKGIKKTEIFRKTPRKRFEFPRKYCKIGSE